MTHVTVHDRGREHSMDERLAYYVVLSGMTLQHNYYNCCVWVYMCMDVYEITFRNVFPVWEKNCPMPFAGCEWWRQWQRQGLDNPDYLIPVFSLADFIYGLMTNMRTFKWTCTFVLFCIWNVCEVGHAKNFFIFLH